MRFQNLPIQKKLIRIILMISGLVILITCITFIIYELFTFRKGTKEKLYTIGKIISANSTAALAFDNAQDAKEVLAALKAEPHIVSAALYDNKGRLFAYYPSSADSKTLPASPGALQYGFTFSNLEGFQPVLYENKTMGTLYMKSDLSAMYGLMQVFGILVLIIIAVSMLVAYFLSKILQRSISAPILALAQTSRVVSQSGDYSQRAVKSGDDELGVLTDSFNQMLERIEKQTFDLNEFTQNLEQKVADRTQELEAANRELEAFSYSISHDLRAPLRGIVGFTTILEEDFTNKLGEEAQRVTATIKKNTMKMAQLIDDLLSFARIGRQEIRKSMINTTDMVRQVIVELELGKEKNIRWNIGTLPDSFVDHATIRQVWVNLVSNAAKYSRKSEAPYIEIGSYPYPDADRVVFFIKDNGVGFDEKYKAKLFKVFQRLHSANEFEGTGVGLAIVDKIISKHGGTVWADAELGKGACFYFSLPVYKEETM